MPDSSVDLAPAVATRLRLGLPVADREFDALLPADVRRASKRYWTPLAVVQTVVEWMEIERVDRVLDVGSGPGKLCVAGALASRFHFTGLEHRHNLHLAACELAARAGVSERTRLIHGGLDAVDLAASPALYLFNPFGENTFPIDEQLDHAVELGEERFHRDVETIETALATCDVGMLVFTYHGFGGRIPDTFAPVRWELAGTDVLRLWKKITAEPRGGHWLELDDALLLKRP